MTARPAKEPVNKALKDKPAGICDECVAEGFPAFRDALGFFVLTNIAGKWLTVSRKDFDALKAGKAKANSALGKKLRERGMFPGRVDREALVAAYREKNRHLFAGPNLHIVIVTLRCNQQCAYCHASRRRMDERRYDMTLDTARKVADTIFETTSPSITIEFQGGEPVANWPALKFIVEYAQKKNATAGKQLNFSLVTNLSLLDKAKTKFLLDNGVLLCTSLDGPADLHRANRTFSGGDSYDDTIRRMERINAEYKKRGYDTMLYHVDALMTTTRASLGRARDIVDEYLSRGIKVLHLRPLNPMGFAQKTWQRIGYSDAEFLAFYRDTLDYVIERNLKGDEIQERMSAIFLTKILTERDPNFLDLRSPCGAGIGQLAYNHDGMIFTCDEGRMVHQMGDDIFALGKAGETPYREIVSHETVKAIGVASCLDCLPRCAECAYRPYCGACPVVNYMEQGDIFGQRARSSRCAIYIGVLDYLFRRLHKADKDVLNIFSKWVTFRQR
ncbi:MAG: His-Xaa-Ser system radical SAM maturase HxsB [Deltaproteobacteria bacterium]|nr:His-Xaa-Ser system radical SAM maturase HxsB [Deltaproteobacteria bacterium]